MWWRIVLNPYFTGLTTLEINSLTGEQRDLLNRIAINIRIGNALMLPGLIAKFDPTIRRNRMSALAMSKILMTMADEFKTDPTQAHLVIALCRIVALHSPNAGLQLEAAIDIIAFGSRIKNAEKSLENILSAPRLIPENMDLKRMAAIEALRWLI